MITCFTPATLAELRGASGRMLGPTDWYEVTQDRVNRFAEATRDFQWIHVDTHRAAAGPLGTPIAHGLLTLSLGPYLSGQLLNLDTFASVLNYGYDRVRFPAAVPVGSRIRMRLSIDRVDEVVSGAQVGTTQTVELEGGTKPVLVAHSLMRVVSD